jgi:hypothetical protein
VARRRVRGKTNPIQWQAYGISGQTKYPDLL